MIIDVFIWDGILLIKLLQEIAKIAKGKSKLCLTFGCLVSLHFGAKFFQILFQTVTLLTVKCPLVKYHFKNTTHFA